MGSKSSNLFHFTPEIDYLKSILEYKFLPRYSKEPASFLNLPNDKEVAYPMVCFCDIPLSRIFEHTEFYGKYGLGLTREWGIQKKLTPLFYSAEDSPLIEFSNFIINAQPNQEDNFHDEVVKHYVNLFPLIKPMKGMQAKKDGSGSVLKDFTQENEWRHVPKPYNILFQDDFSKIDDENNKLKKQSLMFEPTDVKYIFVQNDTEIPVIFDFIQDVFESESDINRTVLTTRIISLETLAQDL